MAAPNLEKDLGAPPITDFVEGDDTLIQYYLLGSTVATDISAVDIEGAQEVSPDALKFEKELEIYQSGGGRRKIKLRPTFNVNLPIFQSRVNSLLAALHGQTFGAGGYYAQALAFDDVPRCNIVFTYRTPDKSVVGSVVLCHMIPKEFTPASKSGNSLVTMPFYSRFVPVNLAVGARCVMDRFAGDGSTVAHTLSQTPLSLINTNVGLKDEFSLDNVIYIRKFSTTDAIGTIIKQNVTVVGKTLTLETALTDLETLEVFYACAVV
jgi:hypothetical protein